MNILISIIKKVTVVFVVVLFLIAGYFFLFLKGNKNELPNLPFIEKTTSATNTASSSEQGINDLRQHLSDLESINIDSDFFNSPAFESLENSKKILPKLKQGRTNPFAPIGE